MTRIHHLRGIECTYPENWQLSEDRDDDQLASFTIQSPNTAFMSVYVSRDGSKPLQLIEEMTEMLSSEYDGVESSPVDADALGLGTALQDLEAVDLNFYYLDLLVTARLIAFSDSQQTVLIQCQAEDREFEALRLVYQAMIVSMLRRAK